jgi:multiple sugar transport system substrate-binding protein
MSIRHRFAATAILLAALALPAHAADFDWQKYRGQTVSFLANNNPLGNAISQNKDAFEKLTGITLKVDTYQEQQMRQRLVTVLNASSDEIDVFMTLVSREGLQFAKAGWYTDLAPLKQLAAPDYDFAGFSPALLKAATIDGKLTSIPMNIEGPVLYWRRDVFAKCGVPAPASLADIEAAAKKIKACDLSITPFVSRGLKDAVAYTFSNFVHNLGGSYLKDGKPDLCSAANLAALNLYGGLLKDYGPPGVVNYSFYQIDALYRAGRAAMAFESQNELANMIEGGARAHDTAIMVLPPGPGGSVPTAIGWGLSISPFSHKSGPAWYLVQWATSPEMQAKIELNGVAAPRTGVDQRPDIRSWLAELPIRGEWQAAVAQIAADGSSEVGFPIVDNPASRSFMGQAVDDVLLGTRPAAAACAEADHGIDQLITGG